MNWSILSITQSGDGAWLATLPAGSFGCPRHGLSRLGWSKSMSTKCQLSVTFLPLSLPSRRRSAQVASFPMSVATGTLAPGHISGLSFARMALTFASVAGASVERIFAAVSATVLWPSFPQAKHILGQRRARTPKAPPRASAASMTSSIISCAVGPSIAHNS